MINNSYKVVTFKNIDHKEAQIIRNGQVLAVIEPGQVVKLPAKVAEYGFKLISKRMLGRKNKSVTNEKDLAALRNQMFLSDDDRPADAPLTPAERTRREIEELNKQPSLPEQTVPTKGPFDLDEDEYVDEVEQFDSVDEDNQALAVDDVNDSVDELTLNTTEDVKDAISKAQRLPTRQELYDYAAENGFVLEDPKTFNYFESLSKEQLIHEIQYPLD